MDDVNGLNLEEVKREVERDYVITGPKAALFLLALVKEEALFEKLKLHEGYELVVRKRRGPA